MTLAHLSDTHLGYIAYGKTVNGRLNTREVDVAKTFRECLAAIVERDPDLIVHSGDFFHVVRPSNYSLIVAYKTLAKIQAQRGHKPFVIVGGNHDTPHTSDAVNILKLFEDIPGVHVEAGEAKALEFEDFEVLCVSHKSLSSGEAISKSPSLGKKHSVMALHGMNDQSKLEQFDFEIEELRAPDWSYVALGDWHIHQAFGPNICYSGSTDFTSSNIWEEAVAPKGWVWFDTEAGQLEFVPVSTRRVIDLPPIEALELDAEGLAAKLREQGRWSAPEAPIVRQRIYNVTPEVRRLIPLQTLRELEAKALVYQIAPFAPAESHSGVGQSATSETLETSWQKHIDAIPISGGVNRTDLKQLGLDLLQEVFEIEADSTLA